MLTPPPEAPTPILPRGAGGPPRRAAGRVFPPCRDALPPERSPAPQAFGLAAPVGLGGLAAVIEADPLLLLHAVAAARELGFAPAEAEPGRHNRPAAIAAVFVGLDTVAACSRCAPAAGRRPAASAPLLVGYAAGGRELLAAHRLHACCDVVLELRAVAGRARFAYLPAGGAVEQARLSTREADVLVLVLAGMSTAAVAERLCVSPATARTHCRALLRKLGAADRGALRARLLGAGSGASAGPGVVVRAPQRFTQPAPRSLPIDRP
ncbi:MAG: LuxR C-terminal-related transcriptional regulator [Actinomycetes bacterium]